MVFLSCYLRCYLDHPKRQKSCYLVLPRKMHFFTKSCYLVLPPWTENVLEKVMNFSGHVIITVRFSCWEYFNICFHTWLIDTLIKFHTTYHLHTISGGCRTLKPNWHYLSKKVFLRLILKMQNSKISKSKKSFISTIQSLVFNRENIIYFELSY